MLHAGCDPALNLANLLQQQHTYHGQQQALGPGPQTPHPQPAPTPLVAHQQRHLQASASDPCAQIAHVLQCYQQGGEQGDFVRKAIESLVKKLKDKQPELDALIEAVTTSGKSPTGCVTIQRSLDGRLQVAGRKGVPHVVYARIWRWPNVNKNELQKFPICRISNDNQDLICVNPYHYERVVSPGISNIDLSSLRIESSQPSSSQASTVSPMQRTPLSSSCALSLKTDADISPVNQQWLSSCAVATSHSNDIFSSGYGMTVATSLVDTIAQRMHMQQQQQQQQRQQSIPRLLNINVIVPHLTPAEHWCSVSYYELDTQIGETFKVRRGQTELVVDGGMDPAGARNGRFCLGALPNVHRTDASEKAR